MTKPVKLDVKLQAEVLQLGQAIAEAKAWNRRVGLRQSSANPEALAIEVERVLKLVRASPANKLFGITKNFIDSEDALRLKALALVGWQMISEATAVFVNDLSKAVVDGKGVPCEQILLARDCIARMVCEGLLAIHPNGGDGWDGKLSLPKATLSWIAGGQNSKGDFDPRKIDLARLRRGGVRDATADTARKRLPTAKRLYEAVRQDVIGLDPQLKVLASRFVLHAIRAEAIKAGADCTEVPQMVCVLIADSGVGKSFTISRFSKHLGLGLCQYDSTVLTGQGYVGADLDEPYRLLVNSVGGDADEGARGVIFLDEFSSKCSRSLGGTHGGRDVSTLAIQQELLCKLQANAPFIIGGKRQFDTRPFLFDGRRTGYILGGTFEGLDEVILKMQGRRDIGFASETGSKTLVTLQSAMVEAGYIRTLVNRIGAFIRLPTPTAQIIERATAHGIVNGFNEILLPQGLLLKPSAPAVRLIAEYAVESRGYYRTAKSVLAVIVEEALFDGRGETIMIEASDVRRAIARLTTGLVQSNSEGGTGYPVDANDGASAESDLGESEMTGV